MKAHEVDSARPDPGIERDELIHYLLRMVQDGTVLRRPHPADPGGWVITLLVGDYRATEATRWVLSTLMAVGLITWEAYTAPWELSGTERARPTALGGRLLWRFDIELGLIPSPDAHVDEPLGGAA